MQNVTKRVLYALDINNSVLRVQARCLGAAFVRAGVGVDFFIAGVASPTLHRGEGSSPFDIVENVVDQHIIDQRASRRTSVSALSNSMSTHAGCLRALRGSGALDLSVYSMVFSESESISAWSSRLQNVPSYSIGRHRMPQPLTLNSVNKRAAEWLGRRLSPTRFALPMTWLPGDDETLPPIVDQSLSRERIAQEYSLVHLPDRSPSDIVSLLGPLRSHHFIVYSNDVERPSQNNNVSFYPASSTGFRHHLSRATRLICNVDFELIAQSLHVGLPVLVAPGEDRQSAEDARSLAMLDLVQSTRRLNVLTLECFLDKRAETVAVGYPDVASSIVGHCLCEDPRDTASLSTRLWSASKVARPGLAAAVAA